MRKQILLLAAATLLHPPSARPEEGMWLLPLIERNMDAMRAKGLTLTADQIYNPQGPCLSDAVVIFGRGCTGAMISAQGLLLTNHHCGYDVIQQHSTTAHDYLQEGFWAQSPAEELHSPDLTVTFLVSKQDVTEIVLRAIGPGMSEQERSRAIGVVSDSLEAQATQANHYNAQVGSFFGGNKFYLVTYETFTDVRLVGAPPRSIGKFGGDTDNWTWPRHTGDFALFRVYADSANRPAPHSPHNVPLRPRHHLPISLAGVQPNELTMVLGYPGDTDRYSTSWEVEEVERIINPARERIRGIRQEILLEEMLADPAIRIKYTAKYARSSNFWKYAIGQNQSLRRLRVAEQKRLAEQEFQQWATQRGHRRERAEYARALGLIRGAVQARADRVRALLYKREALLIGVELFQFAGRADELRRALADTAAYDTQAVIGRFKASARRFYRDYHAPTDRRVAQAMLPLFMESIDPKYHPEHLRQVAARYPGQLGRYVEELFASSIFADTTRLWAFLENPCAQRLQDDMGFAAGWAVRESFLSLRGQIDSIDASYNHGHRLYVAGLMAKRQGQLMYPDANFTMRLTYGTVQGYQPRDAVRYRHYTTLSGVMEKEDPDSWEFLVPPRLRELYAARDFGPYALPDGRMPVNFITNNDITGGNSGSPVINSRGELVGCAFDGNWEAMSSDIIYEPRYQRAISVDIRYVLFIIDRFADARHLIDELTLVRAPWGAPQGERVAD